MSPLFSTLLWNTILAAGLATTVYLLQRFSWLQSRPGLLHCAWLLVLLKLIVPPIFAVPIALETTHQGTLGDEAIPTDLMMDPGDILPVLAADEASVASWSLTRGLLVLAIVGSVLLLLSSWYRTRRISRLVRLARVGPPWLREMTNKLARDMDIQRPVETLAIDGCVSPFLWVTRRSPSIVVPSALIGDMETDRMQLVLRHELTHYARRDHWVNTFSLVVGCLLWWNPVAWWARRELRFAQELCCDAAVLANDVGQRRCYAETLLQTIDFVASEKATLPVPATALGSCSTFKRRIEMISRRDLSSRVPLVTRLAVLSMGALLVATTPTSAHDGEKDELAKMRQELRELRETVSDLKSIIKELARSRNEDSRSDDFDRRERDDDRLTREQLSSMAERARLNDRETKALYQLGEMVDGNPRQFERLIYSDDLNDLQMSVLKKLVDRDEEGDDEDYRARDEDRLTKERLGGMAERARLNERETRALYQLGEMVDGNPRQFKRLIYSDDLNDLQMSVLKKLIDRDEEGDGDYRDRDDEWLTRERLSNLAERAKLSERETRALFQLGEMVDGNPRQFKRLIHSDDLNDTQLRVLKKLIDRDVEGDEPEDRRDDE